MNNLKQFFGQAMEGGYSTGHFNVSNLEQFRAIMEACKEANGATPRLNSGQVAMVGLSEGERKAFGLKQAVACARAFEEEYGIPVFLNPDHSHSVESAKAAFDVGFTSIHIDLSKLPFEENIAGTKEIVDYVRSKNPDISIEGELGYLRGDSKVQKEVIEIKEEDLTKPEEAEEFVKRTGVDRFAGAYGNLHGISANEPKLDIARISAIRKVLPEEVTMVLHGGSGIPDSQIKEAIKAGIGNIHVNTEIRVAFTDALRKSLAENPDETTPYKIMSPAIDAVKNKVLEKLRLFSL